MNRILFAAIYGALFSEVAAVAYFTIAISIGRNGSFNGIIFLMMNVGLFALVPAIFFGIVLGGLGGWFLPQVVRVEKRMAFIVVATMAGGFLGCIPPTLHRLFPPPALQSGISSWEPGFFPFVLIGALCAASWAMLQGFSKQTRWRTEAVKPNVLDGLGGKKP